MNYIIINNKKIFISQIVLILIIGLASVPRFYNIQTVGVLEQDSFLYWHYAAYWSDGHFTFRASSDSPSFYRPLAFFMYGLVVKWFPYQDYAIRAFNGLVDLINVFLVYRIGGRISDIRVGLCAALLYAFSPVMIRFARTELLHTISILFLLLAIYYYVKYLECAYRKHWTMLAASGLMLSLGVHVHTSIGFFVFGFGILMLLDALSQKRQERLQRHELLKNIGIFGVSFVLPVSIILMIFAGQFVGIAENVMYMIHERGGSAFNMRDIFSRFYDISLLQKFISYSILVPSQVIHGLFLANLVMIVINFMYRSSINIKRFVPILMATGFVLALRLILPKETDLKNLTPLVPLLMLQFCVTIHAILLILYKKAPMGAVFVLISVYWLGTGVPVIYNQLTSQSVSHYRILHNDLKELVTGSDKILFTDDPTDYTKPEAIRPYFGNNAVYYHHCDEPLDVFIERNQVKWILVPTNPIRFTTTSLVIPAREWVKSCFELKRDHEKIMRDRVADSGWWIHRILTEEWVNDMLAKGKGTFIYQSPLGRVMQLQ
ncbi:MAG: phospholipid carrier-dependent glycosyltransferase [Magnetococcales bacterium]|nr:glycosyltransferase family 39 protein [Magnetococcales bacterium]NGZ05931.1 phospholipid carrier-dependent glycosyltransferase [Magnetococcales bacterium]